MKTNFAEFILHQQHDRTVTWHHVAVERPQADAMLEGAVDGEPVMANSSSQRDIVAELCQQETDIMASESSLDNSACTTARGIYHPPVLSM